MAHKNKDRKSKVAHTKEQAYGKTFAKHSQTESVRAESAYEPRLSKSASESVEEGRRRPQSRRGGRGGCTTCR